MGWACVDSSSRYSSYCYRTLCCVDIYSLCGPLILRYRDVLSGSARLTGYPVLSRYFIKYGHRQRGDGHHGQTTFGIIYYTAETGRVVEIFKTLQISENSLKSFQFLV